MTDIAPELLEKVQQSFEAETAGLKEEIANGVKSYEEAYAYAIQVGEALSKSFGVNITPEVLPDGMMYYNIADKVVRPMLQAEYELTSAAAVQAQGSANQAAGIGIKPLAADFDEDRAQGIIDRVSSQPFEEVSWLLNEPVKSFSKNVVDQTLEKNVEFQGKSGLSPKIRRTANGETCEWCQAVAGTYEYPNVPKDVYRRHANCDCVVEYIDGGKIQDVWSKKLINPEDRVKMMPESTVRKLDPHQLQATLQAAQDARNVSIPAEVDGNFDDFAALSITENEAKELRALRELSQNSAYEYATVIYSDHIEQGKTSGLSDKVQIEISAEDGNGIKLFHSHTNVTPLSQEDFSFLCNSQVDEIGNIAINGDIFICRVGTGVRPTKEEFYDETDIIASEVDIDIQSHPMFEQWTPEERNYMAIREQAYRIARHYEWELEGGREDE